MVVEFKVMIATPNGIHHPGDFVDVTEARGKELIEKQVAVEVVEHAAIETETSKASADEPVEKAADPVEVTKRKK